MCVGTHTLEWPRVDGGYGGGAGRTFPSSRKPLVVTPLSGVLWGKVLEPLGRRLRPTFVLQQVVAVLLLEPGVSQVPGAKGSPSPSPSPHTAHGQ